LVTDISGQPVGPYFGGQAVQHSSLLGPCRRNWHAELKWQKHNCQSSSHNIPKLQGLQQLQGRSWKSCILQVLFHPVT